LELENLIIKDQLEKKNFKLAIDAKDLAEKVLAKEEETAEAYRKLSYREKLFTTIDDQG
jgi:hypothetical protein